MINPGDRPSRLQLARHATGEAALPQADPAFLAAVEAERARTPAFDWDALRARADRPEPRGEVVAGPSTWFRVARVAAPLLALAAAILLSVRTPPNRLKGDADLGFYLLRDGQVLPGDPDAVYHAGDRIQFTYRGPYDRLVLLSIDGTGTLTVFYPEYGETGVPIVPGERHVLEGSIELDDAPGPEVFLAFFGDSWTVTEARAFAEDAWRDGGADELVEAAEDEPTLVALPLERR